MNITDSVANYPGFPNEVAGYELAAKMLEQANNFGAEVIYDYVMSIKKEDSKFLVVGGTAAYEAKAVIIATGASSRKMGVPGEDHLRGRGVSYCATCDGAFFKDKVITVIGGGDSAIEEALYLTQYGSEVYIVHRRQGFRAAPKNVEKARSNPKIKFILDTVVESVEGREKVEFLKLKNKVTGEVFEHKTDGVFVFIGYIPNTKFVEGFITLNDQGYIPVDRKLQTNIKGAYAVGDVIEKDVKQIVTAAAEGATAAMNVWHFISGV